MSLALLAGPLREQAEALRRFITGTTRDAQITELVGQAFDAAFVGDQEAASRCLDQAEELAARLREARDAAAREDDERQLAAARMRADRAARELARRQLTASRPKNAIRDGLRGNVNVPASTGTRVIAADGSHKGRYLGWAYIASTGQWGLAAEDYGGREDPDAWPGAVIAELRAAEMAAHDIPGPAVILVDSTGAIGFLTAWQSGDLARMPPLADEAPQTRAARRAVNRQRAVAEIATTIAGRRDLAFKHVHGHAGHLLNEAADSLAKIARECRAGDMQRGDLDDVSGRANDLAEQFLRAWRDMETSRA